MIQLELLISTGNRHKVMEISKVLRGYGVALEQRELKIVEPDAGTLEEIALEKARQAFRVLNAPVIAEDTGVYFEAYNSFPGALAKRIYLGIGFAGLLALIKRAGNRRAHFKTAIAYHDRGRERVFTGRLGGTLLEKAVSLEKDRLPYEKLFVPDGYKIAMVDIPIGEKNRVSHRAQAARKLGEWLEGGMLKK